MTFHRSDFQNVLLRRLPPSYRIHCSKRLRSYTQRQGGPISLLFEDGTKASCDVLVGADGVKSAVRRSLLGEKVQWAQSENRWSEAADIKTLIEPAWSGTNAYRALIPADRLRARDPYHRVFKQPTQVRTLLIISVFDDSRCGKSIWARMEYVRPSLVIDSPLTLLCSISWSTPFHTVK